MKPRARGPLGPVVPVEDGKDISQPASLCHYNWATARERRHERDSQGLEFLTVEYEVSARGFVVGVSTRRVPSGRVKRGGKREKYVWAHVG